VIVGLTGGIGAGKSAVARRLERHGAVVIDTDAIAREIVRPPSPVLDSIREAFGPSVFDPSGALSREALAREVFADDAKRKRLNELTHPEILKRVLAAIGKYPRSAIVVVVAPLLYESGFDKNCDVVVSVTAPEELRVARVARRDGAQETEIRARIRAQSGEVAKAGAAPLTVKNDGDEAALDRAVADLWSKLVHASGVGR
jgi:dephospho-CoA kinase